MNEELGQPATRGPRCSYQEQPSFTRSVPDLRASFIEGGFELFLYDFSFCAGAA